MVMSERGRVPADPWKRCKAATVQSGGRSVDRYKVRDQLAWASTPSLILGYPVPGRIAQWRASRYKPGPLRQLYSPGYSKQTLASPVPSGTPHQILQSLGLTPLGGAQILIQRYTTWGACRCTQTLENKSWIFISLSFDSF